MKDSTIWLSKRYRKIVSSIAFLPIIIAILFIGLSYVLIRLDYSESGKHIKSGLSWLRLKDASTARSIISAIVSGIISLSVFSFSNVMVVLNQTASQMSNRILNNLIGNRFQQMVLGIYIGTIIFALFLLSVIRDIDSGVYVPAISTYLLIILTVFDIFLFIYFLHFITQSVKYEVIIHKIYEETQSVMEKMGMVATEAAEKETEAKDNIITAGTSGIYQSFSKPALLSVCDENDCTLQLLQTPGSFVLADAPILSSSKPLSAEAAKDARNSLDITTSEDIQSNFLYGFRQLTEVAVRALGNQDSGTTVESIQALAKLFHYRLSHHPDSEVSNKQNRLRILTRNLSLEQTFSRCVLPIWDYGKNDRIVLYALLYLVSVLCASPLVPSAKRLNDQIQKALDGMKM